MILLGNYRPKYNEYASSSNLHPKQDSHATELPISNLARKDVDILIRREDFDRVKAEFEQAGFTYGQTLDVQFFLDEPNGKIRDAVHLLMAGEKVKPEYASPTPDVGDSERGTEFQVINLQSLVEMKLNSYRDKDRTHLRDMIEIGLIDATWPTRFPATLGARLQELLDDPNG